MFAFLNDLCESHLIPSQTSLKKWDTTKLADLTYLYILGLNILMHHDKTKKWAEDYCHKAGSNNDFLHWRSNANDLYVFLHALNGDPDNDDVKVTGAIAIPASIIRTWLRRSADAADGKTHGLFMRLDAMFHISNSSMKAMRRVIMDWNRTKHDEQQEVLTKLVQLIHARAPSNSEILPELKKLIKIDEAATAGGTSAASIAVSVGGLGAGFSPDEEWRSVYPKKKRSAKPIMLHR